MFSSATGALAGSDELLRLRQGASTVGDYTLQFHILVATSGWNEAALLRTYRYGLNPSILAAMSIHNDTIRLESFMQSHPNFTTLIVMPSQQSHSSVCITRHQSSSTRTHAVGFNLSHLISYPKTSLAVFTCPENAMHRRSESKPSRESHWGMDE